MMNRCLSVFEQKSAKVFENGRKAPVFLLAQACLKLLHKVWTLPRESFLMIFRTGMRPTLRKLCQRGFNLEEMFGNDVNEKNSFDRPIRKSYCIS